MMQILPINHAKDVTDSAVALQLTPGTTPGMIYTPGNTAIEHIEKQ
jgi:hypothetical protein